MDRIDRATFTTMDFQSWRDAKTLVIAPRFQRRKVWSTPAKSYFIDTLLRGLPVPPIYMRIRAGAKVKWIREVVDGQQRISSVLDFMEGKFSLAPALDAPYAGKSFSELSVGQRNSIEQFGFFCEVMHGVSDAEVLQIFARLNTYTVKLNKQELRNGQFFGYFKQLAYGLAYEYVEFWRRNRIFSETSIARMLEVELTSELLISQMYGMQDKKKSIDIYYHKHDQSFAKRRSIERRFRETLAAIDETVGDDLAETEFRRPPLFYSLFGAMYHRTFGLPREDLSSPMKRLTAAERVGFRDAVIRLSNVVDEAREEGVPPDSYARFVAACLRQTDNIIPRRTRLEVLYRQAF